MYILINVTLAVVDVHTSFIS